MAIKKYIKIDSEKGYLEDKDDINYYSANQMRKVAFGKMLGDFDENGLYVINAKIVEELIRMPKVIVEIIEGADLIRSTVKADTFFHFILTVEDNKAQFKLLEKMHYQSNRDFNSGLYSNINEYVLDEVIVTDRDFDRNALYQKYNISTENKGEALSIFDMDELSIAMYYNIVEKIKINYLVQNTLMMKEKKLEVIESNYFENVLNVLAEFKEFGKQVTDGVKKDLAEKHTFVIASKPFFQHTVNEILDSHIDMSMQKLSPEQRQEFETKYRESKKVFYDQFKKVVPIEIVQKSGVRFDANQIVQEGVIGSLVQEIQTKGFTSSDVRKISINEGELQLPVSKIKDIVNQNEEVAKRDNARASDIVTNRPATTAFYKDLEKENKVDVLAPDTTLIKDKIENQQQINVNNNKQEVKVDKQEANTQEQKNTENRQPKKTVEVKPINAPEKKPEIKTEAKPVNVPEKKPEIKTAVKTVAGSNNTNIHDYDDDYSDDSSIRDLGKDSSTNTGGLGKTETQKSGGGEKTHTNKDVIDYTENFIGGLIAEKTSTNSNKVTADAVSKLINNNSTHKNVNDEVISSFIGR